MTTNDDRLDLFELLTAVLLGLAATATALVSHENSLWGGKSVEAYSEAATLTSKASNLDNAAVVDASQDSNVEMEAKKLIREANRAKNSDEKEEAYNLASYMITSLLSDAGYKAFGLPIEYREGNKVEEYLPEAELNKFFEIEAFDEKYSEDLFSEGEEMFDNADKIFEEGREANNIGDKFSFAAVLYAISLFFAGIGGVLQSKQVRWMVLISGAVIFTGSTLYVLTLNWLPLF